MPTGPYAKRVCCSRTRAITVRLSSWQCTPAQLPAMDCWRSGRVWTQFRVGFSERCRSTSLFQPFRSLTVFLHMILFQCGQTPQYPGQDGNSLIQTWKAGVTILIRWQYPRRWCIGLQAAVTGVNHRHTELSSVLPCIKRSKGQSGSSIATLCTVQPPAVTMFPQAGNATEAFSR